MNYLWKKGWWKRDRWNIKTTDLRLKFQIMQISIIVNCFFTLYVPLLRSYMCSIFCTIHTIEIIKNFHLWWQFVKIYVYVYKPNTKLYPDKIFLIWSLLYNAFSHQNRKWKKYVFISGSYFGMAPAVCKILNYNWKPCALNRNRYQCADTKQCGLNDKKGCSSE